SKEEKIKKIKFLIKKIDEKIFMLEDSDDEILLKKLNDEREVLIDSIRLLDSENENINPIKQNANEAIEKIASKVHLGEKIKKIENFIFKFCPVLYKSFLVRKALNKLVMLNENAKELMLKKIPYGESELR